MFEVVGHGPDASARHREALAAGVTASLLATACCLGVAILAAVSTQALHAPLPEVDEMTWVEPAEAIEVLIAPEPPAIRRARQGDPEAVATEPVAEPMPLEESPATELVPTRVLDDAGIARGASSGAATGLATGVLDGAEDGVEQGSGSRRTQVVHHRDLSLLRQPHPPYPSQAWALEQAEHHCVATVHIAPTGRPTTVDVAGCDAVFFAPTQRTLLRWRWRPLDPSYGLGGVETRVRITFRR